MMDIEHLAPASIILGKRLKRTFDPALVSRLAESMAEQGLLNPVTVRRADGEAPVLIAGRHRLAAAEQLGWETVACHVMTADDVEAEIREIDENFLRGELTPAEVSLHDKRRKELHPGPKRGGDRRSERFSKDKIYPLNRYTADAAQRTGRSEAAVKKSVQRAALGDALLGKVIGTSLDKGDELDALLKLPAKQRTALAKKAEAGEKVSAKTLAKRVQRAEREAAMNPPTDLGEFDQKFGVIYTDPPWPYDTWSEQGRDRTPDNHYPLMSEAEIIALQVASVAAENCVLFIWTTVPQAVMAHRVIEAWGFIYRSQWIWDKVDIAMGHWARNRHEVLMIATRGNVAAPAPGEQPESIIREKAGRHSTKPEIFRSWIETLFPTQAKVELFAREQREGWTSWGNEIQTINSWNDGDYAGLACEIGRTKEQQESIYELLIHERPATNEEAVSMAENLLSNWHETSTHH